MNGTKEIIHDLYNEAKVTGHLLRIFDQNS